MCTGPQKKRRAAATSTTTRRSRTTDASRRQPTRRHQPQHRVPDHRRVAAGRLSAPAPQRNRATRRHSRRQRNQLPPGSRRLTGQASANNPAQPNPESRQRRTRNTTNRTERVPQRGSGPTGAGTTNVPDRRRTGRQPTNGHNGDRTSSHDAPPTAKRNQTPEHLRRKTGPPRHPGAAHRGKAAAGPFSTEGAGTVRLRGVIVQGAATQRGLARKEAAARFEQDALIGCTAAPFRPSPNGVLAPLRSPQQPPRADSALHVGPCRRLSWPCLGVR